MAPTDPIVGLNEIFQKDDFPQKVIVGVGAYRDDAGKPYVLPCVREAEQILMDRHVDMEYTGIAGEPKFIDLALKFVYGEDSAPMQENRIQGVQALSGTGGLRVYGELMRKHGHKAIYIPNPTWGNHIPIFQNSGLEVRKYRYYDAESSDLDFANMMKDIKDMPTGSLVLLHACTFSLGGVFYFFISSLFLTYSLTHSLAVRYCCSYRCSQPHRNGSHNGTVEGDERNHQETGPGALL